jgi:ankyrin repeat protein
MNLTQFCICGLVALVSAASLFGSDTMKPDGSTPLHDAVYRDDIKAVARLLHDGADAKAANRYGVTPLSLACTNGDAAAVDLLLKAGADPNTSLPGGETALMTCARTGKVDAVKVLIAHGANVNAKESSRNQTAIMWAAAEGNVEAVEALIQAGANFRERLESGFDPFLFAAREGQTGVVRALLKAGIDANDKIENKRTFGSPSQGLAVPRTGTSALVLAVENGHFELASFLLNAGADPNAAEQGWTALHAITWVRKSGGGDNNPAPIGSGNMTSLELVKKLVAKHADINARMAKKVNVGLTSLNTKDATPFFLAARTSDAELMRALAALGANPMLNNSDNSTPLMAAAGLGTRSPGEDAGTPTEVVEAMKVAIDLGNDPNAVDNNGETAMHGAAYKNYPEAVLFLASHGADIHVWNRPNKHGWTPLVIAEGYRFGNFKPSLVTVDALHKVMSEAGVPYPSAAEIAATAHSVP